MRNGYKREWPVRAGAAMVLAAMVVGCGHSKSSKKKAKPTEPSVAAILTEGYTALEAQQYNDAIAKADQVLAAQAHGPGSAEALYLKGRGLEAKNAAGVTPDEAKSNLQAARQAYISALEQMPKQPLDAYVRTSLGNVAYFQDDYATAVSQWTTAFDHLDSPDLKAWTLYRVGLSQQRLGQFAQADRTFASVQQQFPGSEPARRAREHQGARAFYVQLATFASPASADKVIVDLRGQGVAATRTTDPQGHALLRIGPVGSYSQAEYLKTRFAEQYPDAVIIP